MDIGAFLDIYSKSKSFEIKVLNNKNKAYFNGRTSSIHGRQYKISRLERAYQASSRDVYW
jgi:hypothetical protein